MFIMTVLHTTTVLLAIATMVLPVSAGNVRQLSWEDLIPEHVKSDNLTEGFNQDQKDTLFWILRLLHNLPPRGPETEAFYQQIDEALPSLEESGFDMVEFLAKRKSNGTEVVRQFNGKNVRIPGYILPLEFSGDKVHEFLLVPFVGACIHVPPPPPNQIVNVKVVNEKGYKNRELFEPVWISGVLSVHSISKELYLVDGSDEVIIGYSMQASRIEPYE